jgi:hypothetical protein
MGLGVKPRRRHLLPRAAIVASAIAALGVAAGCSTASNHSAAPARTETVIRTVTQAAPATPHRRPRRAPPITVTPTYPITPTYTSYTGTYFSIDYPDTWSVEAGEVSKGSYFDTTIRSSADPNLLLRIDVTPASSVTTDLISSARHVEQSLASQPGYQELRYEPTTLNGYDALAWEFLVAEHGVLLHKQDTFVRDDSGNDVAILTQAPATAYPRWRYAFTRIRHSIVAAEPLAPSPSPSPSPAPTSEAGFCDTHACIENFDNGGGYIVQCNDGMWSHSGGLPGACSYHGGESGNTYTGSDPSGSYNGSSSGSGGDLGPGNGYTVPCADGTISHSGGIQGACSHHGGVAGP